jgi:predicted ArsR family transcriptional regulator
MRCGGVRPVRRQATIEELKALTHPVRWRILRMCLDESLTNQELARRLGLWPTATLRHIRALAGVGFLVAEPVRTSDKGALERRYHAAGRTCELVLSELHEPELVERGDLADVSAHRRELLDAEPDADRALGRGVMCLDPASRAELSDRIERLFEEFRERQDPEGAELSYLWSWAVS